MKTMRRSILMLHLVAMLFLLTATPVSAQQSLGDSMFQKGESFKVYMDIEDFEAMKNARPGADATLKVLEHVDRYGDRLINKLTPVYCTVIQRKGPGSFGGGGKLVVQIDSTHSTGGDMVPLRGQFELKGGGKFWPKILFFVGWAVKGSDVKFPEQETDRTWDVVVTEDTPVKYVR